MDQSSNGNILKEALTLPCGAVVKNRLLKSAMSEIMGNSDYAPTQALFRLYERWALGGTGLLMTGNVMIDRRALGEPQNVVLEDDRNLDLFKKWAESGKKNNTHIWVQLNHPGRQSPAFLSPEPVAPSAVPYTSELRRAFNTPRALSETDIQDLISRFATSAKLSKEAGFTGVQIHGAHGYLVSQFLSPLYNHREDDWGGSIENRMRFLLEITAAIRAETGPEFPIGVKLNSSDFRKNGFTEEDAMTVIKALDEARVDLIEISGGNYEAPAMMSGNRKNDPNRPFFIDFAERATEEVTVPLVLTGNFRDSETIKSVLEHTKIAMAGIARPLVVDPEMSNTILGGTPYKSSVRPLSTGFSFLDRIAMLEITWYENQMRYIGQGRNPKPRENVYFTVFRILKNMGFIAFKRRRA